MTDSRTRFDRAPAPYDPSSDGPEQLSGAYEQFMEAARLALGAGDHEGAAHALEGAIAAAERDAAGSAALATALMRLGELRHQTGRGLDAEQLFRRALEINERLLGPEHPDLVVLINDLSRLYLKRGAYAEAEPLLLRLHAIKLGKGEDHPEVATVLASLASVRQALGRYDSAEQMWRRVLEIRERTLAPHHFSIATALEQLGETCAARGKLNEALRHRLRALAMREMTLDAGHPSLRTARERIADLQLQASEEVLGIDMPDGSAPAPVWTAPVVPVAASRAVGDSNGQRELPPAPKAQASPPLQAANPVPPSGRPAVPPMAYEPPRSQPANYPAAAEPAPHAAAVRAALGRTAPTPLALAEDEMPDDDSARRDGAESGGLHLVSVAGSGEASRSIIMPYYNDALALAAESGDEFATGRQAPRVMAATLAFLQRRRSAVVAGVGAGVLALGALGASSLSRGTADDAAAGEAAEWRSAPGALAAAERPGAIVDSSTAAGTVERDPGTSERSSGAGLRGEPAVATTPSRPAAESARAETPALLPAAPVTRAIDVRVDPVDPARAAAVTGDQLSARVSLPSGGRMQSIASSANAGAQPALLIVAPTPIFPPSLYTKDFAGSAAVEFVVDTNGRVDLSTFKSQANHELFTEAVRRIAPDMRFVAATRDGQKVRTTVRMRFAFNKSGVSSSRPN